MRLRRPCEHGVYDDHDGDSPDYPFCSGGKFLADDALVIEPDSLDDIRGLYVKARDASWGAFAFVDALFDALAVREGDR